MIWNIEVEEYQILKKGDDIIKNDYRPIGILYVLSKDFEPIVAEQLMSHFEDIFSNLLFAHRNKYGCEHMLEKLIDLLKYALDNDKFVGILLINWPNKSI